MNNFYNIDAISKILNVFKVDDAIISGVKDENLIKLDSLFAVHFFNFISNFTKFRLCIQVIFES